MAQITAVCTIWIHAPQERVWRAITEAEQLSLWFAPGSSWEIPELRTDAAAYFHLAPSAYNTNTEIATLRAVIEAVEVPHRFALRWEQESEEHGKVTTFLLKEENGGTRVTVTETGYEERPQAAQIEEGYGMSLANVKALLEGRSLPY